MGRADCELRAKEAHGGVEPAEHSVDPLNANNQAERLLMSSSECYNLKRGVEQNSNRFTLMFEVGMSIVSTPLSRICNPH